MNPKIFVGGGLNDERWTLNSKNTLISIIRYDKKESIDFDYSILKSENKEIKLKPFDEIQVINKLSKNLNNFVTIQGEVNSEGIYSISNRSIIQIINDAGGFKTNAFKQGIELYRDTIRVGVDDLSIIPLSGDSIYVPLPSGTVTVLGSINNPGPVSYSEDLTINDFIKIAGGYTVYANKKDVFIVYPNGIAKKKTRFNSPKVIEGSTIMVSSSQLVVQQTDYLAASQQIASIISSLATVALIINSQQK